MSILKYAMHLSAENDPTVHGCVSPCFHLQAREITGRRVDTDILCGSGIRTQFRQSEYFGRRIISSQQGNSTFIQRNREGNGIRNILRHMKLEYYF